MRKRIKAEGKECWLEPKQEGKGRKPKRAYVGRLGGEEYSIYERGTSNVERWSAQGKGQPLIARSSPEMMRRLTSCSCVGDASAEELRRYDKR